MKIALRIRRVKRTSAKAGRLPWVEASLELHRGLLAIEPWSKGLQEFYEPHVSLCYGDVSPEDARTLREGCRTEIEALRTAWRVDAVELWRSEGGAWRFHARTGLFQKDAPESISAPKARKKTARLSLAAARFFRNISASRAWRWPRTTKTKPAAPMPDNQTGAPFRI